MLEKKLKEYAKSDMYPFHMPGHKRRFSFDGNPYEIDITEIDGFDNLHQSREILLEVQKKTAHLYGAKESFYLVNGSTCGILAAISASVKRGGKLLMARNCHKSAYNAVFLRELQAAYLFPEETTLGVQGQITVQEVEKRLQENPDAEAIFITSPTYDGVVSDIKSIAEVVHKYEIPLIIDAAHGAHLGFAKGFPENPVKLGADIVIESVHKTLPAFTQTAVLHVCSDRISLENIRKYLGIYETSSPSYILMAGIERCMEYMEYEGRRDLEILRKNLDHFYDEVKDLENIKVVKKEDFDAIEAYGFDESKILIFSKNAQVTGTDIYQILLEEYHLQMEMVSGQYVLAFCSLRDSKEGFERLAQALKEIDKSSIFLKSGKWKWQKRNIYQKREQLLPIYKAEEMDKKVVIFEEAVNKISGEYIYLYPPGIPMLVPGEKITEDVIQDIKASEDAGLTVEGLVGKNRICVVNLF